MNIKSYTIFVFSVIDIIDINKIFIHYLKWYKVQFVSSICKIFVVLSAI